VSRTAFLNGRIVEDFKRIVGYLFYTLDSFSSLKLAKNSQMWVVEFFFKNMGRGQFVLKTPSLELISFA